MTCNQRAKKMNHFHRYRYRVMPMAIILIEWKMESLSAGNNKSLWFMYICTCGLAEPLTASPNQFYWKINNSLSLSLSSSLFLLIKFAIRKRFTFSSANRTDDDDVDDFATHFNFHEKFLIALLASHISHCVAISLHCVKTFRRPSLTITAKPTIGSSFISYSNFWLHFNNMQTQVKWR